jgi:hypothetical protein
MKAFIDYLPKLMILESYLAATICICAGEYNKAIYWACAGTITVCVLRM